jgi:hypothetical protein
VRRALTYIGAFTLAAVATCAGFVAASPSPHVVVVPAHVVGDPGAWVPFQQKP